MMTGSYCERCGAALPSGSKFCRQCGQPLLHTQTTSVTDATTHSLGNFAAGEAPTQHFQAMPHTAAPLTAPPAPGQFAAAPAPFAPRRRGRRAALVLGALMLFFVAVLAITAVTFMSRRRRRMPIPPPPPPPAAAPRSESPLMGTLFYPGAAVVMEIRRGADGDVLQLRTDDPFDRVVNWYEGRLKTAERVRVPGTNVIFKTDDVNVIITNADSGTDILIKEE